MTYKSTPEAMAITAMNVLDGTRFQINWESLSKAWEKEGLGFDGFCAWLVEIAKFSESELESLDPQDFPGVYDYEVSYEIGHMISSYVESYGRLPPEDVWKERVKGSMYEFFKDRK